MIYPVQCCYLKHTIHLHEHQKVTLTLKIVHASLYRFYKPLNSMHNGCGLCMLSRFCSGRTSITHIGPVWWLLQDLIIHIIINLNIAIYKSKLNYLIDYSTVKWIVSLIDQHPWMQMRASQTKIHGGNRRKMMKCRRWLTAGFVLSTTTTRWVTSGVVCVGWYSFGGANGLKHNVKNTCMQYDSVCVCVRACVCVCMCVYALVTKYIWQSLYRINNVSLS